MHNFEEHSYYGKTIHSHGIETVVVLKNIHSIEECSY